MNGHLHLLGALCDPAGPVPGGVLWLGLLLAGAAGSVLHCGPMCGPFVLGQVADRMACLPAARLCEAGRLRAGLLLPYHLGRLSTYAALGAAAALAGGALARLPWLDRLSGALLLLGALLFLAQAAKRLAPRIAARLPGSRTAGRGSLLRRLTARIDRTRPAGGYLLGLALGFLPCGFLYGALAVAGASGTVWQGALGMLAFGAGTAPMLMVIGVAGQAAGRNWTRAVALASPAVMALNAALLTVLAIGRLSGV